MFKKSMLTVFKYNNILLSSFMYNYFIFNHFNIECFKNYYLF